MMFLPESNRAIAAALRATDNIPPSSLNTHTFMYIMRRGCSCKLRQLSTLSLMNFALDFSRRESVALPPTNWWEI
jgi:hypothetical protein